MKNLKKTIGVAMVAGVLCLTGCKSDITFNQENLDQAISSANEYLENQNNYSTEFSYNYLNDILIRGMAKLSSSYLNYEAKTYMIVSDAWGNELMNETYTYKTYKDENTKMVISNIKSGDEEIYGEIKFIKENNELKYNVVIYDSETKTYSEVDYIVSNEEDSDTAPVIPAFILLSPNILEYYETVYTALESAVSNVIMDKVDDTDVFTIMLKSEDSKIHENMRVTFKDGLLVKMETYAIDDTSIFKGSIKDMIEFNYDISKFEVPNKSSYTEKE